MPTSCRGSVMPATGSSEPSNKPGTAKPAVPFLRQEEMERTGAKECERDNPWEREGMAEPVLAQLWPSLIGLLVGASVTFAFNQLQGSVDRRRKRKAIADLLWVDLVLNMSRFEETAPEDLLFDTGAWRDIRASAADVGFGTNAFANITFVYSRLDRWNSLRERRQYAELNPAELTEAFSRAITKLEPYISANLRELMKRQTQEAA